MKLGMVASSGAVALLAATSLAAAGQAARKVPAPLSAPHNAGASVAALTQPAGVLLKEIDDPCTGDRWLLFRDAADPARPGRLVLAAGPRMGQARGSVEEMPGAASLGSKASTPRPIIRAADALIVEEHTAAVDARLEAVALSRAVVGAEFPARLKIGGKVVRAVAVAPGRAIFAPEIAPEIGAWR